MVTFRAPHNSATQIFDFQSKEARTVFGPELILLKPYEQFTLIKLSGGIPKEEARIRNLGLLLGPDFMTDKIMVETCDHARLWLKLAYRWYFKHQKDDTESCARIFSVKDFVGDACKSLSSRIRGAVSSQTFDYFHKNSSEIIKNAVHKRQQDTFLPFEFKSNNLVIT